MDIQNGYFSSIEQAAGHYLSQQSVNKNDSKASNTLSFNDILRQQWNIKESENEISEVKFSKHAGERLAQRNIVLSDEQLARLNEGVTKAGEKGIKESLVILDSLSFIVNTKSNTVITAMEQDMNEDNIYTNIDGAVII